MENYKCELIGGRYLRHLKCRVSYSFLRGLRLCNIAQNTTAYILVEDQLRLSLNIVTVDQERELHRPSSENSTDPAARTPQAPSARTPQTQQLN